jgi:TRAP-type C4-dicarboxylate transport system permease small subunit
MQTHPNSMSVKFSKALNSVGGTLLFLMMMLTVTDVILRYLKRPITGTFELMSYGGALVAGFAIAQTSLDGAHVNVDMLTEAVAERGKNFLMIFNRIIGVGIFVLLAWALFLKGNSLYQSGEVSLTLRVPYYPVAYGLAVSCFAESLVLFADLFKTLVATKKRPGRKRP